MAIVQRWIVARLRHQRFFSLAELNSAIAGLVEQLNDRTMRGLGATRRTLFEQFDRPALLALPPVAYEYAEWRRCRVGLDYHVGIDKRFYSVPHDLLRQEVEMRITAGTVEVFRRGKRVASHVRSASRHPSTTAEHMPSAHRRYQDWTHERIRREAAAVGDDTATLADLILRSRPHPEQGFRSCIGIPANSCSELRGPGGPARHGAGRCCLRPRAGARHPVLHLGRSHPEAPPGPAGRHGRGTEPHAREHPRPRLLPLKGHPMLNHPTAERLRGLGLAAMAEAFTELQNTPEAADLPREDWLGLLVDREATSRDNKRLARRLRDAKLRQAAVVEDTDFRTPRGLDRALFLKLAGCGWIREHAHVVISGPTGVGKSWLACALGHKACREGYSVLYKRAPRLFADLATARGEGRLPRMLATIERTRLLIIDDWGPEPLTAEQRRDLLEIVDDRYDKGSLLITSQVPIPRWHEVIGDMTLGDAILDRVVHRAHRLELKGASLRKRRTTPDALTADASE